MSKFPTTPTDWRKRLQATIRRWTASIQAMSRDAVRAAFSPERRKLSLSLISIVAVVGVGWGTWGVLDSQRVDVPDVMGMSLDDGLAALVSSELDPILSDDAPEPWVQPFTRVISQSPEAGTRVFTGHDITVEFTINRVVVPHFEGLDAGSYQQSLSGRGLALGDRSMTVVRIDNDERGVGVRESVDVESIKSAVSRLGIDASSLPLDGTQSVPGNTNTDEWQVVETHPVPGTWIEAGSEIHVVLALPLTQVPIVTGLPLSEARHFLEDSGLTPVVSRTATFSGSVPEDFSLGLDLGIRDEWGFDELDTLTSRLGSIEGWVVASQGTNAQSIVEVGDRVELSLAWPATQVPRLTGKNEERATELLLKAGLSSGQLDGSGVVQSQSIAPGTTVPVGAAIPADLRHVVEFAVSSSASRGMVTWIAPGQFSIEQANNAALPWTKRFFTTSAPGSYERGNFNAQMNAWDGWITCSIRVDGREVVKKTSTGPFAVVSCG